MTASPGDVFRLGLGEVFRITSGNNWSMTAAATPAAHGEAAGPWYCPLLRPETLMRYLVNDRSRNPRHNSLRRLGEVADP